MIPQKALYKIIAEFIPDAPQTYETSYETRLKVQKLVYLFEAFRGRNSYAFSWYLAGPYSSMLTHQVYELLLQATQDDYEKWDKLEFSDSVCLIVSRLKKLLSSANKLDEQLSEVRLFELLASILYIKENFTSDDSNNCEEQCMKIKKKLLSNKPHFKETHNLDAIIKLVIENCTPVH